jgi:hypothetical protein
MTGSAKQSIARHKERMDCFVASAFARRRASADKSAPRNDGRRHGFAFSRPVAPEVCQSISLPSKKEGAGKAGCALHPRSRVQNCTKKRTRAYRSSGGIRLSLRSGLQLIACSPRRPGSFATVAGGIASTDLTPASGCQDHTILPSASSAFVTGAIRVHRSPPRVDDVAQRPSFGSGWQII